MIRAISQTEVVHWEWHRDSFRTEDGNERLYRALRNCQRRCGSFRAEDCSERLRRALRNCQERVGRVTVVRDNSLAHNGMNAVVAEPEFQGDCSALLLTVYH